MESLSHPSSTKYGSKHESQNSKFDNSNDTSSKKMNTRYDVFVDYEDEICFKYQTPIDDLKQADYSPNSTNTNLNELKPTDSPEKHALKPPKMKTSPTTTRSNKSIVRLGELLEAANQNISSKKRNNCYRIVGKNDSKGVVRYQSPSDQRPKQPVPAPDISTNEKIKNLQIGGPIASPKGLREKMKMNKSRVSQNKTF